MIAPATVAAAAVLVISLAVVGWAARDGRLHEGRPAFSAQLPVLFYEHMHCQHTNHLCQHKGQSSKIEGPAIGVALLIVILTGVTRVGRYVHNYANDVTETWEEFRGVERVSYMMNTIGLFRYDSEMCVFLTCRDKEYTRAQNDVVA